MDEWSDKSPSLHRSSGVCQKRMASENKCLRNQIHSIEELCSKNSFCKSHIYILTFVPVYLKTLRHLYLFTTDRNHIRFPVTYRNISNICKLKALKNIHQIYQLPCQLCLYRCSLLVASFCLPACKRLQCSFFLQNLENK